MMEFTQRMWLACCLIGVALGANAACAEEDFALRDGDRVAFLGDSITAERTYGKIIEQYTLLRYPDRKVSFFNVGRGGETAHGALERLERDVFSLQPTVLTVAYGINDIGWGMRADDAHRQRYLTGIEEIVKRSLERGIRVYICSPAITAADPAKTEGEYLQQMCDEGLARARALGAQTIDVSRGMREIQKRVWAAYSEEKADERKAVLHAPDGIHLSPGGATAMGFVILKGFNAPALVSSVAIDVAATAAVTAEGCTLGDITWKDGVLEFARRDAGLPLNTETFFLLVNRFTPITEELNQYRLRVASLPPGEYQIEVDGKPVHRSNARELARGVNLASATMDAWHPGGPWHAQAVALWELTEARDRLQQSRRLHSAYLAEAPLHQLFTQHLDATNLALEALQRELAAPRPYHFRIVPAAEKSGETPVPTGSAKKE